MYFVAVLCRPLVRLSPDRTLSTFAFFVVVGLFTGAVRFLVVGEEGDRGALV